MASGPQAVRGSPEGVRIKNFNDRLRERDLSGTKGIDTDSFYGELKGGAAEIKGLLWPLAGLSPRERAVFTEYHYWNTHMRVIAQSHRISLGRAYEILYRAEEKIASSRSQEKEEDP